MLVAGRKGFFSNGFNGLTSRGDDITMSMDGNFIHIVVVRASGSIEESFELTNGSKVDSNDELRAFLRRHCRAKPQPKSAEEANC